MVNEREQLRYAIASLEKQRPLLGDDVVDTTVVTLRERLSQIDSYSPDGASLKRSAQRKQVTILFANVTGLARIAESIPDTNILDLMNVLWQRLDSAITKHDGVIDKHIGDAVMGLFGVPTSREDDPERAVRAALAMRAALSDFIAEMESLERSRGTQLLLDADGNSPMRQLQMRIGINTGPVLLGEVGTGDEYTVIGDAVNVASRLEHTVSPGGILISQETYLLVRGIFNVEPLGPVEIRGRSEPIPVYMVLGVKPRPFYSSGRGVEGVETPMVGRDEELARLQQVAETAVETRLGKLVTIVGEAGMGKSRLLHEFNNWLKMRPQIMPTFKGRTYERTRQVPYALFRDLLATKFDIQDNDPPALVEDKLLRGMRTAITGPLSEVRRRAWAIGQLVGLEVRDEMAAHPVTAEAPKVRENAYQYLAEFFRQVTKKAPAAFLYLEDVHWADAGSLELLEHLREVCHEVPLVILCLTRQSLFSGGMHTGLLTADGYASVTLQADEMVQLRPLSSEDSRHLISEILRKLPEIPTDLYKLILDRAEGNPFYLEELVKVLIDDGVIITGAEKWQLQRQQLTNIRVPPNITGVLQSRLDRLSAVERATLQRAAVMGRVFWDTAVIQINQLADNPISAADTLTALQALEKRELIFSRQTSIFTGSQTYVFKHAILQQVTYESVLLRARPVYHKQVAIWLAEQSGERVAEYAGVIARHYELAGEKAPAAELYEMAAVRAQDAHDPSLAIEYYRNALSLLSDKMHQAITQLRLQEQLGDLLKMQGRFVEAAQTYMMMRYTATEDGDLHAQAQAWIGLAGVKREQAAYEEMLESATEAEQVAWLVNAETALARTLTYKGEAYAHLGDRELAASAATRAMEIAKRQESVVTLGTDLATLGGIFIKLGRRELIKDYLGWLKENLSELQLQFDRAQTPELKEAIAFNNYCLGELCCKLGQYEQASSHLMQALKLFGEIDSQLMMETSLNQLAETLRLVGKNEKALPLYRRALGLAEASGDTYGGLFCQVNLAAALVAMEQFEAAESLLHPVVRLATHVGKMVSWRYLPQAYEVLAVARVGLGKLEGAESAARQALRLAQVQGDTVLLGAVWRTLGLVAAGMARKERPLRLEDGTTTSPADCFTESLQRLQAVTRDDAAVQREEALTLWMWAKHEMAHGDPRRGDEMAADTQVIAQTIGISLQ